MRILFALILRHLAERLDPAPPPEPCHLPHFVMPTTYPSTPWITYQDRWSCAANTDTDPSITAWN